MVWKAGQVQGVTGSSLTLSSFSQVGIQSLGQPLMWGWNQSSSHRGLPHGPTHIFEQLISTFGSDSGRVASRGTRAITCSVNGSVTFSHYICSLSGYGSGRAKPHTLYFHADIDSRELERASSLCSAQ